MSENMSDRPVADESLRNQVVAQCRVVAHLASTIAGIYSDLAEGFAAGGWPTILEMRGRASAELMETLGDILNGMDAVTEADAWTAPIFKEAQRRWPVRAGTAPVATELQEFAEFCSEVVEALKLYQYGWDYGERARALLDRMTAPATEEK